MSSKRKLTSMFGPNVWMKKLKKMFIKIVKISLKSINARLICVDCAALSQWTCLVSREVMVKLKCVYKTVKLYLTLISFLPRSRLIPNLLLLLLLLHPTIIIHLNQMLHLHLQLHLLIPLQFPVLWIAMLTMLNVWRNPDALGVSNFFSVLMGKKIDLIIWDLRE